MKIIGNTVGTPLGLDAIKDKLNPLTKENLGEAVNGALAQAKASGEFDGAPGKDGTDGKDGKDGYTPQKGIDYFDGKDGEPGKDGKDGEVGPAGYTPVKGVDYFDGQPGKDGSNGLPGKDGYTPVKGVDYFDGERGPIGETGPQGPQGEQGPKGDKGDTGPAGADGAQGPKGDKGDTGPQGIQGPAGADGAKGDTGAQGPQGIQGIQGPKGDKGDKGDTGAAGSNGAAGKDGTSVTVTSVTESTADGGSNVVTFSDGNTLTVKNGSKGSTGSTGAAGKDGASITVKKVTESTIDGGNNIVEFSDGKIVNIKNGSKGSAGYDLTNADKTAIAEEVSEMISQVTYEFVEKDIAFATQGYAWGTVGETVKFNNGTTGNCKRTQLTVNPGETYRTHGKTYYDSPVYVVTDQNGKILIKGTSGSSKEVIETFTIPMGGAILYVNNTQNGSFVSFEKEEPVESSIIAISKSPISYKTIVYDGDSICHGVNTNGGYARLIAEKVGGMYENQGVGGARLTTKASGDTHHSVCDNVVNLPTTGDLYCFQGGVNDYWANNVPLGTYVKSDFTGAVDTSTVCGALEYIFRYALTNFLGKPICFVVTHKCSGAIYNKNAMGDTFEDYRNAMVSICNKYSIPYYDAFNESGLNGWNTAQKSTYFQNADGCHPTEDGYKRYYVPQLISLFERIMSRD